MISYVTAQCQSTKKLNIKDIVEFPWENDNPVANKKNTKIDKKKIEQLKALAQDLIKNNMI